MKKFITWMLACLILVSTVAGTASNVQAATVSRNNPVNGDYSYYAVYGTIYRVNNQTGKNTKIKALKDAFELFDLTYYKGYLYFTEDLYYGTEMEKNQICRMKADGSGYEVLGWGQSPTIYKDRIYYIKNKVVTDVYGSSTEAVGIAKMDQGCRIYYFDTKSRKKKQVCSIPNGDGNFSGVIGKNVYYYCYDKQATYCYNLSSKKTMKLIDKNVTILTTKGKYMVVECFLSQKEFEKTGKTNEIAIMKKSGKGYKKLIRFYVS